MCQAVSFFRTIIQWKKKENTSSVRQSAVSQAEPCPKLCHAHPPRGGGHASRAPFDCLASTWQQEKSSGPLTAYNNCQSVRVSGCRAQQSRPRERWGGGAGVAYQTVPRVCLHQSHPWSESDPTSVRQGILKWFAMIKCVKTELKSTFHENIVSPRARQLPGNEKSRYFCLLWSNEGSVRLSPPPHPHLCVNYIINL